MYKIKLHKDCDSSDVIKFGFKKYGTNYRLNVPLYKYKNTPIISVSFAITESFEYIGFDIIDCNSGDLYIHFYNREYSNSKNNAVLKKVIQELNNQFQKMKSAKIITEYMEVE